MRVRLAGLSRADRPVLGEIALEVGPRETVAILGPSGIGKTTLLRAIAGLETPPGAEIEGAGRVAMVFQEPTLMPWRDVLANVTVPTRCAEADARALIAGVGLAGREGSFPRGLSLGQQRRVALARAFAARPDTLLLDEPFVSLDPEVSVAMQGLLAELIDAHPVRVILVTHALEEALRLADRVVRLSGTPARVAGSRRIGTPRAARTPEWIAGAAREAAAG